MATQSGLLLDGPGKPLRVSDSVPQPRPGKAQALVKCLAVSINPIETMQKQTGILVNSWPAVLGSDCVGIVTEVGPDCIRLRIGDYVFGCAPLGQNDLTPFQASFLVHESVFLRKSPQLSIEGASTMGAGLLTAALCLLAGAEMQLPEVGATVAAKDEWVVVLGGTGSVGQYGIQIARLCGFKVLASCSPQKAELVTSYGANATFNNRDPVDKQLAAIEKITKGNFARMFDATTYGYELMVKALETHSNGSTKYLASVDDWSEFNTPAGIKEYRAELGHLCRLVDDPIGVEVTRDIENWVPSLEKHIERGNLKPLDYEVAKGLGWEAVARAVQDLEDGKASKKIVVKIQA